MKTARNLELKLSTNIDTIEKLEGDLNISVRNPEIRPTIGLAKTFTNNKMDQSHNAKGLSQARLSKKLQEILES